ncbi:MAG: hypothetical protein CMM48_04640 [Rhodospirillaceae bacterium]|nr:hypothetical protein [Rhodospirillaceae bacterium]
MTDNQYRVVWPRSPRTQTPQVLAPRLDTLEGKRIAQLWDLIFRGDEIFDILEERLAKQYPGVSFVSWREFGCTHGEDERDVLAALPERFKELGVDAAISGMAC